MGILLPVLLFLLAVAIFCTVKLGFISNQTLQVLANSAAVVAAVAAIVIIPWSISSNKSDSQKLDELSGKFPLQISSPKNGAKVGEFVTVEGYTKYTKLNHYIVVESQTGTVAVTDGPLSIDNHGHWTGEARLGTGNLGKGEFYLIHVVATTTELRIGETSMAEVKTSSSAIATVNVSRRN